MATPNLHTIDSDTLLEMLMLCPDLSSLRCLIETHPVIHHVFTSRRRLILRTVFRNQITADAPGPYQAMGPANSSILKNKSNNPIDVVAFRESIWPEIEHLLKHGPVVTWATALLAAFHAAKLDHEALAFSQRITTLFLKKKHRFGPAARSFFKSAIRTHVLAGLEKEAMRLQERVLDCLTINRPAHPDMHSTWENRDTLEHSKWAKDLADTYRRTGSTDRLIAFQLGSWELYRTIVGPNSDVTLDWARALVLTYQHSKRNEKALEFHARVRKTLDPTKAQYLAWSRQLIRMYQRQHRGAEALIATREVWNLLRPESKGYRAWTTQLSNAYEANGRPEDAVRVCEDAWRAISARLEEKPKAKSWQYQTIGAGLSLVQAYKTHGRLEDAAVVEATCTKLRQSRLTDN
jgi:tetratricopeptide (TPR) repeat protein